MGSEIKLGQRDALRAHKAIERLHNTLAVSKITLNTQYTTPAELLFILWTARARSRRPGIRGGKHLPYMEGDRGGGVPPKAEKELSTPRLFFESRLPLGPPLVLSHALHLAARVSNDAGSIRLRFILTDDGALRSVILSSDTYFHSLFAFDRLSYGH